MANYEVPENPEYNESIRKFEISDPVHADLVNAVIQQLIHNGAYLKNVISVTGYCRTGKNIAEKVVESPGFVRKDGARIMVTFAQGSSTNYMTLNVNGTGGVAVWFPINGSRSYNNEAIATFITAGCAYEFIFQDGDAPKWIYCGMTFTGNYNDLSNRPAIPTVPSSLPADGGNADTVDSVHFHPGDSSGAPNGFGYVYGFGAGGDNNAYVFPTAQMSVNYANSAGTATKAQQDGNGKKISSSYLSRDGGAMAGEVYSEQGFVFETGEVPSRGIGFVYQSEPITVPDYASGYGNAKIYDGLICADNIDSGYINYIARNGSSRGGTHYFVSLNDKGSSCGVAYINGGYVVAKSFDSLGGDYAEYWEYQDGNPDAEDRAGLFVVFAGKYVKIAQKGDPLIQIGVVSAAPSIIGDSDLREWPHKYEKDIFGREIWKETASEDGTFTRERVINAAYDPTQNYVRRANRPEWAAIGTHGKLVVVDDGTCVVNGFCAPSDGGIATASEEGFYVMERLDKTHIRIYMR